ncbi:flavin reductase family protein [Jidongwangia harbinensis]|uniref:flavin reductase family protein n=1 Tax=Jidongwangia harbinensis TaxID=2878561 RepID=UPI001CDA535B|nr:flavin reductase family protein [Jidongwangia harbinensis]MCA2212153.1 flavin reductase family protein [Jidongwangia harbinensis]
MTRTWAPETFETGALKAVFGTFTTGVVIVTTRGPTGLTCQTFCPLSLDPPLVGVAVAGDSSSGARLRAEGVACFNILDRTAEPLARRFGTPGVNRFTGLDWRPSPVLGLPLLDRTLAWVEATITDDITVGDHHLLVARVAGLGASRPGSPLTFFRGRFQSLPGDETPADQVRRTDFER